MSYQVFARKYRPQTFSEVIGQDHVVRTLANAIERDRLAHAYLFVGPRGTGKTSTARILAKALNCAKGPTVTPCGQCAACVEIARGSSLDVIEIDGASNNGVEQVRELRENARFAPARDRFKIYIIDEVHMLSAAAFNALLKTLEEPPAHVKFLFATTEVHKVLPTILSRCQRFDLRRIPDAQIAAHLLRIASLEGINLDPRAAAAVARGADGGMRDAESMLDQLVAFCGDTIREEDVTGVFGLVPREAVARLAGLLLARDAPGALAEAAAHEEAGRDLSRLTADLISHLRDLLVAKVDPAALAGAMDDGALAALKDQAALVSQERLLELISQFAEAETKMRWASNKRLHLEVALLKAVQFLGETTLAEVLESFTSGRPLPAPPGPPAPSSPSRPEPDTPAPRRAAATAAAPAAVKTPQPPEPPAAPEPAPDPPQNREAPAAAAPGSQPAGADDPQRLWEQVITAARAERPFASHWIMAGHLLAIEGGVARIGFATADKAACDALRAPNFSAFLDDLLTRCAGRPLKAALSVRDDLAPRPPAPAPPPAQPDHEKNAASPQAEELKRVIEEFENDPKIQAALEIFEGALKTGS